MGYSVHTEHRLSTFLFEPRRVLPSRVEWAAADRLPGRTCILFAFSSSLAALLLPCLRDPRDSLCSRPRDRSFCFIYSVLSPVSCSKWRPKPVKCLSPHSLVATTFPPSCHNHGYMNLIGTSFLKSVYFVMEGSPQSTQEHCSYSLGQNARYPLI